MVSSVICAQESRVGAYWIPWAVEVGEARAPQAMERGAPAPLMGQGESSPYKKDGKGADKEGMANEHAWGRRHGGAALQGAPRRMVA